MQLNMTYFWVFAGLILFSGCFQAYEVYEFKTAENRFDWGTVGAKLLGEKQKINGKIIKKSPYELLFWFDSNDTKKGSIKINKIELQYAKNKIDAFQKKGVIEKKFEKYKSTYTAYFAFKNINLDYHDLRCTISFIIERNGTSDEQVVELFLEKNLKKFTRIIGV